MVNLHEKLRSPLPIVRCLLLSDGGLDLVPGVHITPTLTLRDRTGKTTTTRQYRSPPLKNAAHLDNSQAHRHRSTSGIARSGQECPKNCRHPHAGQKHQLFRRSPQLKLVTIDTAIRLHISRPSKFAQDRASHRDPIRPASGRCIVPKLAAPPRGSGSRTHAAISTLSSLIRLIIRRWPPRPPPMGSRYFYAAGYNAPQEVIVHWRPENLRIRKGATIKNSKGTKRPLTMDDISAILEQVNREPDGTIRSLASLNIGNVKGPFMYAGRRKDDPNDWCPHEHRRELRGLYVIGSLINHYDMKDHNSMDVYVGENGEGYLKHYLMDFGSTFGSDGNKPSRLSKAMPMCLTFAMLACPR